MPRNAWERFKGPFEFRVCAYICSNALLGVLAHPIADIFSHALLARPYAPYPLRPLARTRPGCIRSDALAS